MPCWLSQGPDLGRSRPLRTHWEWGSWLCRPFQQCLSAVRMTGVPCCLHPSQILIPLIPNRSLHHLPLGVKCQQLLPLALRKESGVSVNTRDDTTIPSQEPGLSQELQGLEASPGDPQSVLPPQTPSRTPTLSQVQTGGTAGKAPACQCRR